MYFQYINLLQMTETEQEQQIDVGRMLRTADLAAADLKAGMQQPEPTELYRTKLVTSGVRDTVDDTLKNKLLEKHVVGLFDEKPRKT